MYNLDKIQISISDFPFDCKNALLFDDRKEILCDCYGQYKLLKLLLNKCPKNRLRIAPFESIVKKACA